MLLRKAHKVRLRAQSDVEFDVFPRYAGCCRFVWNKALALQMDRLKSNDRCLTYNDMAGLLVSWKKDYPFLQGAPSQALQQRLMDLDKALKEAFDPKNPKRFPRFKKKHRSVPSFRYPQGFEINGSRIFLPKFGWVRFFKSCDITGTPKNITVSRQGKHWYASIQTEREVPDPIHWSGRSTGIDFGVKRLLTLSDGTYYEPVNSLKKMLQKLAIAQCKLARMVTRSRNWQKQKRRIGDLHIRVANVRRNHLHGISNELSKNHAVIAIEDLRVKDMSASAKGTVQDPGRNVRQKAGLNRAILDQGWSELKRQIEYKQLWRGGQIFLVDPYGTSQECSSCGHSSPDNRLSQSLFCCEECGHTDNADVNAAMVVKSRAGLARMACESNGALMPSEAGTDRVAA